MAHYPIHWVTVSSSLTNEMSRPPIMSRLEISTIGNVLSTQYYQQAQVQETKASNEQAPCQIFFVATRTDDPIRGWSYLTAAMQQLAELASKLETQVQPTLVGALSDRTLLKQIPAPVQHLGSISDAERLHSLYTESSILISTSERKSFGQILLEALACSTLVITRNLGGPTGIPINGVNGTLVMHNKLQKMAIALWQHFTETTVYQSEACQAFTLCSTPTAITQQRAQLYAQLVDDTQRANR